MKEMERTTETETRHVDLWISKMAASDEHAAGVSRSEALSQGCKKDDWHDDEAFRHFVALHGPSLRLSGLPEVYWPRLHHKLRNEVCDVWGL